MYNTNTPTSYFFPPEAATMTTEQSVVSALTYNGTPTAAGGFDGEYLMRYMVLNEPEKKILSLICVLTGPVTFLENILVLVVIGTTDNLRKRPTYLFIGSLAAADVLASSFFPIIFLDFHLFKRSDSPEIYLFKLGGVTMAFTGSVGSLLLTSMDRYLCIYQAPRYKSLMTCRRALFGIVALWITTVVISFLPIFGWRCWSASLCSLLFPYVAPLYIGCWVGLMLIVLFLIVGAYALILWKAHQHEAAMEAPTAGRSTMGRHARMRVDIHLAQTLGLILMILVLCWVPSLSIMLIDVSRKLTINEQRAFAFCGTLCLVNSAVNPLLYALRCRKLRRALVNLLRRVCGVCCRGKPVCVCLQNKDGDVKKYAETVSESLDKQNPG
ncbi:cannabinoid receptor 2-like [Astyanax mexicanus]|uniref:Cannabinoid receptor 2-like n=1 Tax=Astyanax mexicanus TaxID=7994 RepID=A0A8T2M206_ASTMX|nr:cannabinoid receptor 2-like [Astyanax mexicanus]